MKESYEQFLKQSQCKCQVCEKIKNNRKSKIIFDELTENELECHFIVVMSPEQSYWHPIKPKGFEPGIQTSEGKAMVAKVCLDTFLEKSKRKGLDHTVNNGVYEVGYQGDRDLIAGKKADRYDIKATGTALYQSSGLDLTAVQFTCLLSPTLEIKGMVFK